MDPAPPVFTIGHSVRPLDELLDLLDLHAIAALADVRRYPGSRRHPHFSAAALAPALAARGIAYHWFEDLGGRRAAPAGDADCAAWRVAGFRGYCGWMREAPWLAALERLDRLARDRRCAVMCSEALWTRCHRRLIADALTVRGREVRHVIDARRVEPHQLPAFAVVEGAVLRYPAPRPTGPAQGRGAGPASGTSATGADGTVAVPDSGSS